MKRLLAAFLGLAFSAFAWGADTSYMQPGITTAIPIKAVDNGDGTFSYSTRVSGTGTASITAQGTAAAGSAPVGNPVQIGGSDGAAMRTIATDTSGRMVVVGSGVAGTTTVGNPVLSAGTDGTSTRVITTDTTGRLIAVGAAAAGSAIAGNPVLAAGSDGTNARAITTDTTGNQIVVGNVASAAADSASPVKIGTKVSTTSSGVGTFTTAQRADTWGTAQGALVVATPSATGGDGVTNAVSIFASPDGVTTRPLAAAPFLSNGSTLDQQRGNMDTAALITATGATSTQTGADQVNYNGRGVIVVLDMTTVGTGSVTITIQGKDVASGKYYTLLVGAAVVSNSTNVYTVYPGAAVTANVSANGPVPRTWRVLVTANNANATTYKVGASVIN